MGIMGRVQETEAGFGDLETCTHICACGSKVWNLQVCFEDYEISFYMLQMSCAVCGTLAIAPTPVDRPDND